MWVSLSSIFRLFTSLKYVGLFYKALHFDLFWWPPGTRIMNMSSKNGKKKCYPFNLRCLVTDIWNWRVLWVQCTKLRIVQKNSEHVVIKGTLKQGNNVSRMEKHANRSSENTLILPQKVLMFIKIQNINSSPVLQHLTLCSWPSPGRLGNKI